MLRLALVFLLIANVLIFLAGRDEKKVNTLPPSLANDKIVLIRNDVSNSRFATQEESMFDQSLCIEWGPHLEEQIINARSALLESGSRRFEENVKMIDISSWWVNIEGFATRREADTMVASLRSRGVTDISVVEIQQSFVLSLGIFSSEDGAKTRLNELLEIGIEQVQITPRGTSAVFFLINDLDREQIERLRQIAANYGQSQIRTIPCETSPEA
ncbi:MAG: SPOR domain-containing protein [Burkholderiales bacterium]|jgi:hypothetical protein|nr:SPOR domain-containing protein [Burkholderiales bacterium]